MALGLVMNAPRGHPILDPSKPPVRPSPKLHFSGAFTGSTRVLARPLALDTALDDLRPSILGVQERLRTANAVKYRRLMQIKHCKVWGPLSLDETHGTKRIDLPEEAIYIRTAGLRQVDLEGCVNLMLCQLHIDHRPRRTAAGIQCKYRTALFTVLITDGPSSHCSRIEIMYRTGDVSDFECAKQMLDSELGAIETDLLFTSAMTGGRDSFRVRLSTSSNAASSQLKHPVSSYSTPLAAADVKDDTQPRPLPGSQTFGGNHYSDAPYQGDLPPSNRESVAQASNAEIPLSLSDGYAAVREHLDYFWSTDLKQDLPWFKVPDLLKKHKKPLSTVRTDLNAVLRQLNIPFHEDTNPINPFSDTGSVKDFICSCVPIHSTRPFMIFKIRLQQCSSWSRGTHITVDFWVAEKYDMDCCRDTGKQVLTTLNRRLV